MQEEHEGQSRLFVILSISLIGLLVLGLLGIGGVFIIRQNMEQQASLASRPTPTLLIKLPKPTTTPTQTKESSTAKSTPTNTPVVIANKGSAEGGEKAAAGSSNNKDDKVEKNSQDATTTATPKPTATRRSVAIGSPAGSSSKSSTVPNTGLGGFEIVGIATGLLFVVFIARRLRTG